MRNLLFCGLVLALLGCPRTAPRPNQTAADDLSIPVPEFKLTERSGKSISRDDLKGKVWVASFVFTRCTGPCPQVTATMARLQSELRLTDTSDLRLVTFTVDPERDTPDDLRDYAKHYSADQDRWLFLTGKEEEIHQLLKDGFKVTAQRSKSAKAGEEFDHSSRLVVVDKRGNIRGIADGARSGSSLDPDADLTASLEKLKTKVAELLKE